MLAGGRTPGRPLIPPRRRRPVVPGLDPRYGAGIAGASTGQDDVELFAPAGRNADVILVGGEHQTQRIEHVLARLIPRHALTDSSRNLDDTGNDPAVLV